MSEDKKKALTVKDKKVAVSFGERVKRIGAAIARPFKESYSELKKVTWPTRKQLITYTLVVSVFVIIVAAVVGIIDFGLLQIYGLAF